MKIPEVRLVYLTTEFTASETFSHPFIFHFSVERYKLWKLLQVTITDIKCKLRIDNGNLDGVST